MPLRVTVLRRASSRLMWLSSLLVTLLGHASALSNPRGGFRNRSSSPPIPITVLSGFLGAGKTSLLQNLLENNQGLRIAVIVNDAASINIDSKLVSQQQQQRPGASAAGLVELQNGCACCSLSEELLSSVSELVTLSDLRGEDLNFHHIVIELSGVADPKSVRAKFQEAVLYDMPLMERVSLDTMVSLVDCSVFLDQLRSTKVATREEAPELFYRDGIVPEEPDWAEDLPPALLEALLAGEKAYGSREPSMAMNQDSSVVDLLVAQCEIADVVLLNKIDLASAQDVRRIESIVQALNPRAALMESKFGSVPVANILAVAKGVGVAQAGLVDDHKDFVQATSVNEHQHSHALSTHSKHNTSNTHEHSHDRDDHCSDPNNCADASHSHTHEHSNACQDPDCTDKSHSHDSFSHGSIGTFVYRARRPFHPNRLVSFLRYLSLSRGLPPVENADESDLNVSDRGKRILKGVLRSKGFVWCADSNDAAMFWSHAGTSFELSCLGRWWSTLNREQWPPEATPSILLDFDSPSHDENDPCFASVGDRRQEVVFIGPGLGSESAQQVLNQVLDQCILQEDEWNSYCKIRNDANALSKTFVNPIRAKMATY